MTAMELKHQEKLRRWSEMVGECRSSRITVKQWCKEHGITPSTYYRWEREVLSKAKEAKEAEQPFPPVSFAAIPIPELPSRNYSERIATFRYGELSLDVYRGAEPETVSLLLEALRSC